MEKRLHRVELQVIGIGAAGNKQAIELVEKGILQKDDILLINSTIRDIPTAYQDIAFIYKTEGGAGKSTAAGTQLANIALESQGLDQYIDTKLKQNTELVIILFSMQGGTGAGGSKPIAGFVKDQIDLPVILLATGGFMEDPTECRNMIEVGQSLTSDYGIQMISNLKALKGKDYIKAQQIVNDDIAERIKAMMCSGIVDSEQNIDDTDLFNVLTVPEYSDILYTDFPNLNSIDDFNSAVDTMIAKSLSFESDTVLKTKIDDKKLGKRAIFINLKNPKEKAFIDFSFEKLEEIYGVPYANYIHVQYEADQPSYMRVILTGLDMPMEEFKNIHKKYLELDAKNIKSHSSFFDDIKSLQGDADDHFHDHLTTRGRRKRNVSGAKFVESNNGVKDDNGIY